jgi:hypothetical protein
MTPSETLLRLAEAAWPCSSNSFAYRLRDLSWGKARPRKGLNSGMDWLVSLLRDWVSQEVLGCG